MAETEESFKHELIKLAKIVEIIEIIMNVYSNTKIFKILKL
jgi:hypothetical protein